jgi:hypothetical protein
MVRLSVRKTILSGKRTERIARSPIPSRLEPPGNQESIALANPLPLVHDHLEVKRECLGIVEQLGLPNDFLRVDDS